ncbi:MAG TPA: transglutaminase-like domain-containing protein, partial [Planctomycetota bacterium]|nr:transglutaminase-like domain-containing protein [Planctomycetota bacterium]
MRRFAVIAACALCVMSARVLSADVDLVVRPAVGTHVEHITKSPHTFTVTADAETMRPFSRNSIPDDVLQWVKIEGAAKNPKLRVEGLPDLSSADALLRSVLRPGMTDAEKALAVYTAVARFAVYTSSPSRSTWGMDDPIIGLNCGAGICGNFTIWTKALAWRAGLDARTFELTHHTVPEIFYDGGWHMFDPTTRTFYIGSDNRSVASVRELEQHTELMKRAGASQRDLSFYDPPGNNRLGGHNGRTGWRMDVTLRPGESLTRKTFQDGPSLWDYEINRNKRYASGSLAWRPDLNRGKPDEFLKARSNLAHSPDNPPALRPKAPRVGAHAVFNVTSPYPITRAALEGCFGKAGEASTLDVFVTAYAPGMTTWRRRALTLKETGLGIRTIDLTPFVFGTYAYDVEFRMTAAVRDEPTGIHMIAFENTLHLNRYALPQLTGGENRVTYVDDGDARDVTVTFNLEEKH